MSKQRDIQCSRCQALIPIEDFKQGLAVKIDKKPVCQICLEAGNPQQQAAASRIPLMQQNIYRFTHDSYNNLNRFTFLTAGHIALHRRIDREQGQFDPPELPDSSDETQALSAHATTRLDNRAIQANQGNPNLPIVIGVAAAVLITLVIIIINVSGDNPGDDSRISNDESGSTTGNHVNNTDDPDGTGSTRTLQRNDLPRDPEQAWQDARSKLQADDPLLLAVAEELKQKQISQLNRAAKLLDARASAEALEVLQKVRVPEHQAFTDLHARKQALMEQRNQLIAGTSDTDTDATDTDDQEPEATEYQELAFQRLLNLNSQVSDDNLLKDMGPHAYNAVSQNISSSSFGKHAALQFSSGSSLTVDPGLQYPHSFFIDFWFRIDESKGDAYQWLYSHGRNNSPGSINIYFTESDNQVEPLTLRTVIAFSDLDALKVNSSNCDIDFFDGRWHNYALRVTHEDGATVLIDGNAVARQENICGPFDPQQQLIIGAQHDLSNNFKGALAQIQIYQGIISEDKIADSIATQLEALQAAHEQPADTEPGPEPGTDATDDDTKTDTADDSHLAAVHTAEAWTVKNIDLPASLKANTVSAFDFDGDKDMDLLLAVSNNSFIAVNNGHGEFGSHVRYSLNPGELDTVAAVSADMNGDGHPDIIEANNGDSFFVYLNDGGGTFLKSAPVRRIFDDIHSLLVADFNNDGRNDIYIGQYGDADLIYFNDGSGDNIHQWKYISLENSTSMTVAIHDDVDGDGDQDLIVGTNQNGVQVLINNGVGEFTNRGTVSGSEHGRIKRLRLKQDGKRRFILFNSGNSLYQAENLSGNMLKAQPLATHVNNFNVSDITGDSDQEVFCIASRRFTILAGDEVRSFKLNRASVEMCAADLNGDGFTDLAGTGGGRINILEPFVMLRRSDDSNTGSTSDEPGDQTAQDDSDADAQDQPEPAERNPPKPVILSRFDADRDFKPMRVYDKGIEAPDSLPQLRGNVTEHNYPVAISSDYDYKDKYNYIDIDIGKRDVSNGGVLLILHPYDLQRKAVTVSFEDVNGIKTLPATCALETSAWQTVAVDLSNPPGDFDASQVTRVRIRDVEAGNSINFLLYRMLFYKGFVPIPEDLPKAKQVVATTDIEAMQFRYARVMDRRRPDLADTLILIHQKLKDKNDYVFEIRKQLNPVLGKLLPNSQVEVFEINENWLANTYIKKILRRSGRRFVIVIGVGNQLQYNDDRPQTTDFWKAFCAQSAKRNIFPILICGPGPNENDRSKPFWDLMFGNDFLTNKIFGAFPLVDLRDGYMKEGNFNRYKKSQSIDEIVRAVHDILARLHEIPED